MEIRYWQELDQSTREMILRRSGIDIESVSDTVKTIVSEVRSHGDTACLRYSRELDQVELEEIGIEVSQEEIEAAAGHLSQSVKTAITRAVEQVGAFHRTQRDERLSFIETSPGLYVAERFTPIDATGLYVPRGRGSFPSMLYMLAIPAHLAGVSSISVTTPPLPDGSVDPACLYAAELCGVHHVYRLGGAQAVAALAFGTETIAPVDKIVGPGSVFVAAAKRHVSDVVDVGLPAGPSESVILADATASPWKLALDLTIEAEHGADSQALLITPSNDTARQTICFLEELVGELPEPRKTFVTEVLAGYGGVVVTADMTEAIELVNQIAPEHLSIQTDDPMHELSSIRHAGEILLGANTPFSLANYAAGANAVLPTGGAARTWSPVSVRDFQKASSVVYATERALAEQADTVATLADYEGFPAHARAIRRRSGE